MFQKQPLTTFILFLWSVLTMGLWSSCSKYNSESVGSSFFPANSQVRLFTHPVYVEFSQDLEPRIWGPYTKEVDVSVHDNHVTLKNASDSLALFIYGYPAVDGVSSTDNSITIESDKNFALYLNKLQMRSVEHTAIRSTGSGTCFLVIPKNTVNKLTTVSASAVFEQNGPLIVTGEGELVLTNESPASLQPVALRVQGGLHCQYATKLTLHCTEGDALQVNEGPMRSSLGTWNFEAGQHAINTPNDSIVLIAGTYSGVARDGKFFSNGIGAVIRQASVQGLSGQPSDLLDTLQLYQHYDSVLVTIQQHFDTISVEADSALAIGQLHSTSSLATFKPFASMEKPWVLLSHSSLQPSDTLIVIQNQQK